MEQGEDVHILSDFWTAVGGIFRKPVYLPPGISAGSVVRLCILVRALGADEGRTPDLDKDRKKRAGGFHRPSVPTDRWAPGRRRGLVAAASRHVRFGKDPSSSVEE